MSPIRAKLICTQMACAFVLASVGCMAPWAAPMAEKSPNTVRAHTPSTAQVHGNPSISTSNDGGPEANLAGVLEKLQQVRAMDPAAEQKLIDELRQTPAESWPLVAEQFRASLAYREQLAARKAQPLPRTDLAQAAVPPLVPAGTVDESTTSVPENSAAIVRSQSTRSPTQESNDSSPPPAKISRDGLAYPIAKPTAPPDSSAVEFPPTVLPATFETESGRALAAAQAQPRRPDAPLAEQPPAADDVDWQQHVRMAASDLTKKVADSPTTTAEVHQHVSLRMLRLLAGDTEGALEPIPHISPLEQDYWSSQLFAMASYLDHHSQPDDKRRAAASVTHLDEAVSHLRELGSLSLRNLSFCKNVYGYGAIEHYESDRFAPGDEVSLYVEVENYNSKSTEKGFCTLLGSSYELLDEDGERVGGGEFPDVDDCCRSRRRDFHIQYGVTLPASIPPGHYRLQLVVKDRQSDKLGNAGIPFEIRGNRP